MNLSVPQMIEHVKSLASAFEVVLVFDHLLPRDVAGAVMVPVEGRNVRGVIARVITDETGYAVVLHELGHHLSALGSYRSLTFKHPPTMMDHPTVRHQYARQMWDEEVAAWEWAEHYALQWTVAMEQVKTIALASYDEHRRNVR
jgi:hypothetical protein